MNADKISVIVPVYDVEKYLTDCIESILNQTYQNFELILVDDASPDNCPELCDKYAESENRIHVIHQENSGLSGARNAGIEYVLQNCDSQWITFIDSDDWVGECYLQNLLFACKNNGTLVSSIGFQIMHDRHGNDDDHDKGNYTSLYTPEQFWCSTEKEIPGINAASACGKLFKKALWEKFRFDEGRYYEDQLLIYKLLFQQDNISYSFSKQYFYFQNEQSITHNNMTNEKFDDWLIAVKEQSQFFKNRYSKAYVKSVKSYVLLLDKAIYESKKTPCFSKKNNYYRNELRKTLKRNQKIINSKEFGWAYSSAYPVKHRICKIYKFVKGIFIKKVG